MEISVPGNGYPVLTGSNGATLDRLAGLVAGRDVLIVTDTNVAPLHLKSIEEVLTSVSRLESLAVEAGEAAKTLETFSRIVDALVVEHFHRDALVVALGGGVIGDMAGFAAACYQRGVDWIAVPTTLLAQVDAALGGKTAVNHAAGKNLVGAFHDPIAVWADPARLHTLPEREFRAGFAEMVKYGLGFDADFFGWLERHASALRARDETALIEAISHCARIKLGIVAADHDERGSRASLNLGHTLGHAIETALGHGLWLHGEAVAAGLVAAAELSSGRGRVAPALPGRLRRILSAFELPVACPSEADDAALLQALSLDKKIAAGRLRFIGLAGLGHAEIWNDVGQEEIATVIQTLRSR